MREDGEKMALELSGLNDERRLQAKSKFKWLLENELFRKRTGAFYLELSSCKLGEDHLSRTVPIGRCERR